MSSTIEHHPRVCGKYLQNIANAIWRERDRQEELVDAGKFAETCADPKMADGIKLAVLMEGVGDVATEVLGGGSEERLIHLRTELIQVAAVAAAWIEALDRSLEGEE